MQNIQSINEFVVKNSKSKMENSDQLFKSKNVDLAVL